MKNTFGSDLSLTIFGESHGRAIGAVLDGMAAGLPVDETFLAACMDKRRARGDGLSTPRVEADTVQLLSGVVNGRTTGTAIALMIENTNTRSGDYAKTADLLRPGHADYTAYAKYHGFQDARGGGHFSGRVTAALVAGGAIVLGALHRAGIDITTHITECAGIADTRFALDDAAQLSAQVEALASKPEGFAVLDESVEEPMKAAIRAAGAEGDSVGGMLETAILGLYEVIEAFGYTKTDEFGYISYTDEGVTFASKIFEVLNEVKDNFTEEYSFNIESVPAERAAVILCQKDNVLYDHNDKFIYSNQWIPLSAKCTIQEKLRLCSILDEKCSGGSIAHINLESNFPNTDMAWEMLNKIAQSGVIYFAFNTRINECKHHHGFVGTDHCPVCGEPVFDTYQRIVGYLVPSRAYSKDRFREFNTRQWYTYAEAMSE